MCNINERMHRSLTIHNTLQESKSAIFIFFKSDFLSKHGPVLWSTLQRLGTLCPDGVNTMITINPFGILVLSVQLFNDIY